MKPADYLMLCLGEEGSELAQAVSKVLRFTPDDSAIIHGPTNMERLIMEYNDILAVVEMLKEHGVDIPRVQTLIDHKKERLATYMRYSERLGVVDVSVN